jgi:catechol 2,3-dioxygenase
MTADDAPWRLPDATAIGRVGLVVTDLEACTDFYRDVVGLSVQARDEGGVTLGAGDEPLLELRQDPDAPRRDPAATGLFHTAFRVPARQALADALGRVERHARLDGASDHLVSEALYLADPEGNGVEIYRDRPRSEWPAADGGVAMDTLPLDLGDLRGEAAGADRAPDGTTVGHVHLEVSSIQRSRSFYVDRLGFEVRQSMGDSALFVAAGGYHHHVGLNTWNDRSDPPSGRGLDWFELLVPDEETAETLQDRLPSPGTDTSHKSRVQTTDPDGIVLEVTTR